MSPELLADLAAIEPEIWLTGTIVATLVLDLIVGHRAKHLVGLLGLAGVIGALTALLGHGPTVDADLGMVGVTPSRAFGLLTVDGYSWFFRALIISATGLVMLHAMVFRGLEDRTRNEFHPMLLGAALGACLLVSTDNLIMLIVGMELLSLSSYVMAGWQKRERRSAEAGLKYLVYGAMSSGLMLFGFSLLYGMTGSMWMYEIADQVTRFWEAGDPATQAAVVAASVLVFVGFGFKVSMFPFHFWAPDVYEGSPTPVTTMLAVASKTAGFGVLVRFVDTVYLDTDVSADWMGRFGWIIAVLAAITMTYGNVTAMRQTNVKRLLAYSSIAHAGYLLMGVAVMAAAPNLPALGDAGAGASFARHLVDEGMGAVLFYLVTYYLATIGVFGCAMALANRFGAETLEDYEGLGWSTPWLCVCMVVFLVSLVGLPPAVGLIGKWLLFRATLNAGLEWLAVIAAINAVVALYYYWRIARNLFLRGDHEAQEGLANPGVIPALANASLFLLAAGTIWFCFSFDGLMDWVNASLL